MNHPKETTLALHSSGDLGWFARWRTERHLAGCAECRDEVAGFREMREALPDLAELPEAPWNKIAAEMRANIRLGLAAGECVRGGELVEPSPLFGKARAALAFAGLFTLVITGLVLEGVSPTVAGRPAEPVAQATSNGILIRAGEQGFGLMHSGARAVITTVSAQSMGASYVDPQTGLVTMTKVYVE